MIDIPDIIKYGEKTIRKKNLLSFDWIKIQNYYNNGNSWKEVKKCFKLSDIYIQLARKFGLIKSRNLKEAMLIASQKFQWQKTCHTTESRKKISESRKKYYKNNPNKVPWKLNIKGKSYVCEKIKDELRKLNINFKEEIMPLYHKNRFFCCDIAFPEIKTIIEINGRQHYDLNGSLKPYYQKRHNLIENEGWIIYEIPYSNAKREDFIKNFIIPLINNKSINSNIIYYIKQFHKQKQCKCGKNIQSRCNSCLKCRNRFDNLCPTKEYFHYLLWNIGKNKMQEIFNVSYSVINRWCKQFNFKEWPNSTYFYQKNIGLIVDYQI